MPAQIEFSLLNTVPQSEATLATGVFINNALALTPVADCEPDKDPAAKFQYVCWQFLNPSSGADAFFVWSDAFTVRVTGTYSAGKGCKQQTVMAELPVYRGSSYLICAEDIGLMHAGETSQYKLIIAQCGSTDSKQVELINRAKGLTIVAELCMAGTPVGRFDPFPMNCSVAYQADNTLLFKALSSNLPNSPFTPEQLDAGVNAQAFTPLDSTLSVQVSFEVCRSAKDNPGCGKAGEAYRVYIVKQSEGRLP